MSPSQPLRILLVDDSPSDRALFSAAIEDCPLFTAEVTEALSFEDAKRALFQQDFDAILLDLGLPGVVGLDGVRGLMALSSGPMLILTGNRDEEIAREALALGAADYLIKEHADSPAILGRAIRYSVERHRSTEERRRAERLIHQVQNMESIDILMRSISHDLGNILTPIQISAWAGEQTATGQTKELFGEINTSLHLATDLLERMKNIRLMCRQETDTAAERVRIDEACSVCVKLIRRVLPPNIELVTNFGALEEEEIFIKKSEFPHVVLNLAINAIHALRNVSQAQIELRWTTRLHNGLEMIALEVRDNGCGIPAAIRERIFEPFFTTKQDEGTGFGLVTTRLFMNDHGGEIELESEEGSGTTFRLLFPRLSVSVDRAVGRRGSLEQLGLVLLLVEPSPRTSTLTQFFLAEAGISVVLAGDAASARKQFAAHGRSIDLVLLDPALPDENGLKLMRDLQLEDPTLRFVLAVKDIDRLDLVDPGSDAAPAVMRKPYTIDVLLQSIRQALGLDEGNHSPSLAVRSS